MEHNRKIKEFVLRYIFLCIGLTIMCFGIAFSIKASLGTTPISSLPYVTSKIFGLTVGTTTIIMHCTFIVAQILLLRKSYNLVQLMQLPVALLFGGMTDLALYVISSITYSSYMEQWLLCILGIILVAIGVSFEVTANVVVVAGEGLVIAICRVFPIKFGTMKVTFDVSLVLISIVLSLTLLGTLDGIREGTIAAAVGVGLIVKHLAKYMWHLDRLLSKISNETSDKLLEAHENGK